MQDNGNDAIWGLVGDLLPFLGYAILIIAALFFIRMALSIRRDAHRRAMRHKQIQERRIAQQQRHPR